MYRNFMSLLIVNTNDISSLHKEPYVGSVESFFSLLRGFKLNFESFLSIL